MLLVGERRRSRRLPSDPQRVERAIEHSSHLGWVRARLPVQPNLGNLHH
jgi:hypothetical protein